MAGLTVMYGQHYPFENLPDLTRIPHQRNDHPRLLTEEEIDTLQCMYLWVQSGLKVYRRGNFEINVPLCTNPSYGEVWWILQIYKLFTEIPKTEDLVNRHIAEYIRLNPPIPNIGPPPPESIHHNLSNPAENTFNILNMPTLGLAIWPNFNECLNNAKNQIQLNVHFENNLIYTRSMNGGAN